MTEHHHETERPSVWAETVGQVARRAEGARRSTPLNAGSHAVLPSEQEFISIITPCFSLVAPVGMTGEAQDIWLESATIALADIPVDLLRAGTKAAMSTADHPSKIVPAIIKEVDRLRASHNRTASNRVWEGADNAPNVLPAPGGERPTSDEVDAICKQFSVGRYSKAADVTTGRPAPMSLDPNRPCRKPTRADYLAMGISPDVLDAIEAEEAAKKAAEKGIAA